ncbi:SpoIIE family protein phosphatase [Microcoleus vaginatus]|uniref:SpoIIE family protein phosphatase n=1 Tax=Microcoleus vaginatus TaxID=119532 RepID=UPI0016893F39|nr:SpoIIE family protein phosphatase [Microcoleus sp. FACHB-84]MBD2007311.1 SpoIIE family protein phosphatase [Microcoleus sp. FACHB-45]
MKRSFFNSIRTKLIVSFLLVALIPLLLLAFINKQTTQKALTDNARQALSAAANETANRIDGFIDANLNAVRVEAILPGLAAYLGLPPERRNGSPQEMLATETLTRLSRKDMLNIISYALLNLEGRNVLDTNTPDVGRDESGQDYFQEPLKTQLSFVSSIRQSPTISNLVTLFFSSPVRDAKGNILGVLRVAYNATSVQQLVTRETEHAGAKSLGVLLDEHYIHLAHSTTPELLFKSIVPLPPNVVAKLQREGRLPKNLTKELAINLPDLKQALDTKQPYLTTRLAATGNNELSLLAIAHLKYQPWSILFAQPIAVALAPVEKQIRDALLLLAIIATIVTIIAFAIAQLLTKPVIYLTQAVAQFTAGNLDMRVKMRSRDEIGLLARSFNSMARQIQESFETLEDKVKERTAELANANQEIITLNEKLKVDNLRLGAELNVARHIQQMILPNPEELEIDGLDIAGYMEPADEVGGDYYDVLQIDGVVTLAIGDVTGHGLESGILMLMAQTSVRTLQELRELDPVRFLDVLNRTLYKNVQRMNSEKSLTLAILSYSQGVISISGQHEETLVVRKNGDVERIDTMELGFPIALDDDIADFISHILIELEPGDGVVLYTDGIPEAYNIRKKQYGLKQLCQVISQNWHKSAAGVKDAVIVDVRQHIGKQKVFDDITLLVFKLQADVTEKGNLVNKIISPEEMLQ